jgi:hypothetical protein
MHCASSDNAYYKPYEVKASETLKSGSLPAVLLPKSLDLMIWARKFERATDWIEGEVREEGEAS